MWNEAEDFNHPSWMGQNHHNICTWGWTPLNTIEHHWTHIFECKFDVGFSQDLRYLRENLIPSTDRSSCFLCHKLGMYPSFHVKTSRVLVLIHVFQLSTRRSSMPSCGTCKEGWSSASWLLHLWKIGWSRNEYWQYWPPDYWHLQGHLLGKSLNWTTSCPF